jgi:hypothetical protein
VNRLAENGWQGAVGKRRLAKSGWQTAAGKERLAKIGWLDSSAGLLLLLRQVRASALTLRANL